MASADPGGALFPDGGVLFPEDTGPLERVCFWVTSTVAVSPSTTLNRAVRSSGVAGTGLRVVVVAGVGGPAAGVPELPGTSHTAPANRAATATTVAITGTS